jgi:hypothetical protein
MKRLAVFVEGQTEQVFVERLVKEVAGARHVAIQSIKSTGGGSAPRLITTITADAISGQRFYVLICDCAGDGRVVGEIVEQAPSLSATGYDRVLGLRDLYPLALADAARVRTAMAHALRRLTLSVDVILAVMEIEAWFLAERSHFSRVDGRLTPSAVQHLLKARGEDGPCDEIPHPAETLNAIYASVGRSYQKQRKQVARIVDAIDYCHLYCELPATVPALRSLCAELDAFLTV